MLDEEFIVPELVLNVCDKELMIDMQPKTITDW